MGGRHFVLIVDDDPSIRLLCRINLELDGHQVLEAESLDEARTALEQEPVAVVILDVHLRDGNGIEFLAELRRDRAGLPVVLLTGSADAESVLRARPDAVLGKPFVLDELRSTVDRLGGGVLRGRI